MLKRFIFTTILFFSFVYAIEFDGFSKVEDFNTTALRKQWWDSQEYQWKLTFNVLLGRGKTITKPPDESILKLYNRDALFLYGFELTNLSGLKYLTNLRNLNAGYNNLTSIKGVENLTNLIKLKVNDNRITSIKEVKNLVNLQEFRCEYNDIYEIESVSNLIHLERLNISNNFISDISGLENIVLLQELKMGTNEIKSLINLSKLKNLKYLRADRNKIKTLEGITQLTNLERVNLSRNELVSLQGIENLTKIKQFYFSSNFDLDEDEVDRVKSLLKKKRERYIYIILALFLIIVIIILVIILYEIHKRIKEIEKKIQRKKSIKNLLKDKSAHYFFDEKRGLIWWNNLDDDWKNLFNIHLNNGDSLFIPKANMIKKLFAETHFIFKANTVKTLSGLNNLTRIRKLTFFNETPKFLELFNNLESLNNLKNLKHINFSTNKIKNISNYETLCQKYKITYQKNDKIYTKKGSIIKLNESKCHFKYPIVVLGNIEGIHRGHAKLLTVLSRRAKETSGEAIVLTFSYHTYHILELKVKPFMILEKDKKERIFFKKYKIHSLLYLDFTRELKDLSAEDFIKNILFEAIGTKEIICGYDTQFGKDRKGDYKLLQRVGKKYGIRTFIIRPYKIVNEIVSSNTIRQKLKQGDIVEANKYLGRKYSIVGKVVTGKKIGRKLGFPTVNITPVQELKLIPKNGVYITFIKIRGRKHYSLTNIGIAPSIKNSKERNIETYILGFNGVFYQKRVEIFFLERLRDEEKFSSKQKLVAQIKKDIEKLEDYDRVN